ncbi:MAG: beta-ketoacyl synthase [Halioglobus sp.]
MSRNRLPVIVGFGGVNPAGRASGHHAYARMVHDAMPAATQARTLQSLAQLMGVSSDDSDFILNHTLVRRIEASHFDVDAVPWNQRLPAQSNGQPASFELEVKHLPKQVPANWEVSHHSVTHVTVKIRGEQDFLLPTQREFDVKSAGQLPTGLEPGKLYQSRNHPRGLQMTVLAASDALGSLGIDWQTVSESVSADQVSVYAGSAMGQLDGAGAGGMLKSRYNGQRVTSKYCPLSFAEMPADFINAYVLGSLGATGASLGACASFLYNLRHGIDDIRSGRARVAFIGTSEAPITPEIMEGYAAMGALATVKGLRTLDGLSDRKEPDYRRACRPFGNNCGFTIAESAQMIVLFDDELAMELGATMYGAAADVFVNADGHKKSISGPGVGNYITMAKSVALAKAIVGEAAMANTGFVAAHGTGTPQNRVTEAAILSQTAAAFGLKDWPVVAVKAYLGHSIGSAAGDQIAAALGVWEHGILPGITTIDAVADDVAQSHLAFHRDHLEVDAQAQRYAIINAKGFGGNNATATLLSPSTTQDMLRKRYSNAQWQAWERANEGVKARQQSYDDGMLAGKVDPIYHFDHGVLTDAHVTLSESQLQLGGHTVDLTLDSPYPDMKPD